MSEAQISNWMHMSRWIVKMLRDEYGIDEKILTRTAELEADCGFSQEMLESILERLAEAFEIVYPSGTFDEVLRMEELCLLTSWAKGLYKRPDFLSDDYAARFASVNGIEP